MNPTPRVVLRATIVLAILSWLAVPDSGTRTTMFAELRNELSGARGFADFPVVVLAGCLLGLGQIGAMVRPWKIWYAPTILSAAALVVMFLQAWCVPLPLESYAQFTAGGWWLAAVATLTLGIEAVLARWKSYRIGLGALFLTAFFAFPTTRAALRWLRPPQVLVLQNVSRSHTESWRISVESERGREVFGDEDFASSKILGRDLPLLEARGRSARLNVLRPELGRDSVLISISARLSANSVSIFEVGVSCPNVMFLAADQRAEFMDTAYGGRVDTIHVCTYRQDRSPELVWASHTPPARTEPGTR